MNNNSFSKAIGLSNNVTIGNIVGGRMSKPGYEILNSIALSFDSINTDWLLTGRGEMVKTKLYENKEFAPSVAADATEQYGCKFCHEKEKVIGTQEKLIKSQEKLIDLLSSNRSSDVSSKRKAV